MYFMAAMIPDFAQSPELTAATNCPLTKIINNTGKWTEDDLSMLIAAKKRCASLFSDAPCLKVFTKKSEDTYNALCGMSIK